MLALCSALTLSAAIQVKVWQGKLSVPAYEEGLPDVNPPFDAFADTRFNYPYTLRTNMTGRRVTRDLRAIYLENEYLKCSVLPDIGGHVYSCTDKISGRDLFYANPSLKKQLIGYRGAWAASPVDFTRDGMEPFLRSPRVEYLRGEIEKKFGNDAASREDWNRARSGRGVFAALAARELGSPDWKDRMSEIAGQSPEPGGASVQRGIALIALVRTDEGRRVLHEVLREPDRNLSHYFAGRALATAEER